jgi:hypothetical protein
MIDFTKRAISEERRLKRLGSRAVAAVAFCAGLHSVSHAADPRYPDWPCVQAKVPEISVAAVWDGPPIEKAADTWQSDSAIKDMVARLAARRTPMEEAQKSIAEFLSGDAPAKADKGKQLFAGLFETLNNERSEVINGLERLARSEKALAEQIKSDAAALHELQDQSPPDQSKIGELAGRVEWSTRIFEDRRRSIRYACEVPVIIEKRLFALSRTIQQSVEP